MDLCMCVCEFLSLYVCVVVGGGGSVHVYEGVVVRAYFPLFQSPFLFFFLTLILILLSSHFFSFSHTSLIITI